MADPKAMNWLSMSEAPRDGSRVVAWCPQAEDWVVVHWWTTSDGVIACWADVADDGSVYTDGSLTHFLVIEPPH